MNANVLSLQEEFEKSRKYWEDKLGGEINELKFPCDYPKTNNYKADKYEIVLNEELSNRLLSISKNQDLLLFIIIMTGLKILLYKYSGQEDIIIASPVYKDGNIQNINKCVIFRDKLKDEVSFKELLKNIKQTISEGYKNQHYPLDKLIGQIEDGESLHLLKIALMMEGIHEDEAENEITKFPSNQLCIKIAKKDNRIAIKIIYNLCLFTKDSIITLGNRFISILKQATDDTNKELRNFTILSEEEKKRILFEFNDTKQDFPHDKTIHSLFEEQVNKTPQNIALVYKEHSMTYSELDKEANRLANYLISEQGIKPDTLVGLFIENRIEQIIAILGILKSGGAYVPISTGLPEERIKTIINDSEINLIISTKKNIKMLNKLQWECGSFKTFLCIDTKDIYSEQESQESGLMDKKLWEYIGENAIDEITGGGWSSSYTGEDLTKEEMAEYAQNVYEKLKPFLKSETRVLEIGCASGISMFKIAPDVGMYYGTDLSSIIIEKDRERAERENYTNIKLECLAAHEIDKISEKDFDIVIINSVIQAFSGHNYLRQVIQKALRLMGEKGVLFIGDVMDQDKKYELQESLLEFKRQNPGYNTKTDISEELFISRSFFEDLLIEVEEIDKVDFSNKIHTIENELTRYRYDSIFTIDKLKKQKPASSKKNRHQYDLNALNGYSCNAPISNVMPQNLAYIIYTSGTTGKPKGVMLEHKGVANLKTVFDNVLKLNENDRVIHFASISFDASVWDIFTGLLTGATLYIMPEEVIGDYIKFEDFLNKNKITFATLPPTYIVNLDTNKMTSLRMLITAGSATNMDILNIWKDRVQYINGYGPTESTVCTTLWKHQRDYNIANLVPIGKPVNNIRVYIVDKDNNLQPIGVEGELCIAGVSLARGYLNRLELTAEKFIQSSFLPGERIYKSGDLAKWLPDGNIEFIGRKDDQVKIRGFRIETGEIEYQMLKHGLITEVAVIPKGNEDKYLCAYFVAQERLAIAEIKDFLARRLPDYMIPLYFMQLDSMPLTSNNKINVKALPDPDGRQNLGVKYVAPRNEEEKKLAEIWKEILGIDKIGIDDNFFELGGHSLKATALVTKIHKTFKTEIQLKEVFNVPTVRKLADKIKNSVQSIYSSINSAEVLENCPKGYYPVSSAQKRLYTINQFEGIGTGYNMPAAVMIDGGLDNERFEHTFKELINRHESLRTCFGTLDGEVFQIIQEDAQLIIEYMNIEDKKSVLGISEKEMAKDIINEFVRPFDLSRAPLLRVALVKLVPDKHILMIDMHHIISDGMSMNVLIKEFAYLYQGLRLPELRIQYKDYAAWQNELFNTETLKKQENYWKNTFSGDIHALDMPCDYPRSSIQSFEGDRINFEINSSLTKKLNDLAAKTGTTLYMVMLAAYNILLSKYTGQDDIVVGTPVAGRHHPDVDGIIGFFINTVAIRNSINENYTFIEFLANIKDKTLEAFENQDYQFEQLVDVLSIPRDLSRNPLFDTMFVMQNLDNNQISIPNLKFTSVEIDYKTSKFDLKMEAMEWEDEIHLGLEYKTKLFKRQTAVRMTQHYINVLRYIAESPDLSVSQINLMSDDERENIIYEFNKNANVSKDIKSIEQQNTVKHMFEKQAEETPDNIALVSGNIRFTYRELNEKANSLGRLLSKKGIKNGDIVGILSLQTHYMIIGILGVLKAGAAYLPIDPQFPVERIEYMLEDSGAKLLLRYEELPNKVLFNGEVLYLDSSNAYDNDISNLPDISVEKDLLYVIYTSGTTGNPKGVMIENHSVLNYTNWFANKFDIGREDKTVIVSSLCFDLAYTSLYSSLLRGSELHLISRQEYSDPELLLPYIKSNGITYLKLTPSLFNVITNSALFLNPKICEELRLVVLGGEEINVKDIEIFNKVYPKATLVNHYGPTETTIGAIAQAINFTHFEEYKQHPAIGKPVNNTAVYILDKGMNPVPAGIKGEIYISGSGVARGYINKPELDANKFILNPFENRHTDTTTTNNFKRMYRTGDIGRYLPDGSIEFYGRADRQVKIRGYRVELAEIEALILGYDTVTEAHIMLKGEEDKSIVAYIVCSGELNEIKLREYLAERLPNYMLPSFFIKIEKIPLTLNGKIDVKALPEVQREINSNYEAPAGDVEIRVTALFSEILKIQLIDVNDNFFDIGGHSLKAALLVNRIHKEFNVAIPLNKVFTLATVRNISKYINEAKNSIYSSIQPAEKNELYALSSAQRRMFILSKFDETGITYNMPGVIEISGALDRERFEEAFKELVSRHETLRTSFEVIDEQPVQIIHEQADLTIKYCEAEESNIRRLIKEFVRPFSLNKVPLLRVQLVKIIDNDSIDNQRHIMLYDMPHIISDGVSRRVLVDEFIKLYAGEKLEPLKIQYKDFSVWQNNLFKSGAIQEQEEYWRSRFEGEIPVLNMPTDYERPDIKSFAGSNIAFKLDRELSSKLNNLTVKTGTTLYMVLLAAYNVLISRYSGQQDLVVGSPIAGRPHADLENIVGMFVNMIAIRNYPERNKAFNEFLGEVKENCLRAYENQEYQYEELVDKLGAKRDLSRNPLFDVSFTLQNLDIEEKDAGSVKFKPYSFEGTVSKFDLTLWCAKDNDIIEFVFEYCTALYKKETVERLIKDYIRILESIVKDNSIKIKDIELEDTYVKCERVLPDEIQFNF